MKTSANNQRQLNDLMGRVDTMLQAGQAEAALHMLDSAGQSGPAIRNARGVCLLRLKRWEAAHKLFRELAFRDQPFIIPEGTPTVIRANYVTSMLCMGNTGVGLDLLGEIPDRQHPYVQKLQGAGKAWLKSLPWWRRVLQAIGVCPDAAINLGFPPGELDIDGQMDENVQQPSRRD